MHCSRKYYNITLAKADCQAISMYWNKLCFLQGLGDNSFVEIYNGLSRTYRANRLNASTRYLFRLAAINGVGKRCVQNIHRNLVYHKALYCVQYGLNSHASAEIHAK